MTREYEVTYLTKEYLMRHNWKILAFNPPGSQGTFTIPNPKKDPTYRGQTGSESPDIIAFKEVENKNIILVVESKPQYHEKDVDKMKNMFKSALRRKLFLHILSHQAKANGVIIDLSKSTKIVLGKAHFGDAHPRGDVITFKISIKNKVWNPENFRSNENIFDYFKIDEITFSGR